MAKKTIDIGNLSEAQQGAIKAQIEAAKEAVTQEEAATAKERVEFYYKVKDKIQDDLLEQLKPGIGYALARKEGETNGWSKSKILKQIASLPAKKPTTDAGYITAARNIEKGKPRKISKEIRDKRKLEAAAKKEKAAKKTAAKALFSKKVSDRKTKSVEKKKTKIATRIMKDSAGAMAVGDDGLTKHQRYEQKRVRTSGQAERKEEQRRMRRASGKKG